MWECHTGAAWLLHVDMYAHACMHMCEWTRTHTYQHEETRHTLACPGLNDWLKIDDFCCVSGLIYGPCHRYNAWEWPE